MIDTDLAIRSPEGVSFRYELAPLPDRAKAYALDLVIRALAMTAISMALTAGFGWSGGAQVGVQIVIFFGVQWGYFVLFEMLWDGQSPGKRALGLRVIKQAGHPIGFYDSAIRNLLRAADMMPTLPLVGPFGLPTYGFAALCVIVTRRFQRLGDLAAGTIVVREQRGELTALTALPPLPDSQGLRGVVLSNRERRLLGEFARRRTRLHPARCEELAEILAAPYRERFGLISHASATELLLELHRSAVRDGVRA